MNNSPAIIFSLIELFHVNKKIYNEFSMFFKKITKCLAKNQKKIKSLANVYIYVYMMCQKRVVVLKGGLIAYERVLYEVIRLIQAKELGGL